jgi:hypothetical protein
MPGITKTIEYEEAILINQINSKQKRKNTQTVIDK